MHVEVVGKHGPSEEVAELKCQSSSVAILTFYQVTYLQIFKLPDLRLI